MFSVGDIVFIKNYQYQDGGSPTDKILIILDIAKNGTLILEARTTSKLNVPEENLHHGCNKITGTELSFFMFKEKRIIGLTTPQNTDFSFNKDTLLLFYQCINAVEIEHYEAYKKHKPSIMARLNDNEFKRVVKCVKASKQIKQKVIRAFSDFFGDNDSENLNTVSISN